jgi:hypothetical protein
MKMVNQFITASGVTLMLLSGAGCMSNGSTTAQSHDNAREPTPRLPLIPKILLPIGLDLIILVGPVSIRHAIIAS